MANILHRVTKQYLESVNTPDYSAEEWIINPILPDCDSSEWVIEGNLVRETTQEEKADKIAEKLAREEAKRAKEAFDEGKRNADKIKLRNDFMALSIDDKLLYLYDKDI